MIVDTPAMMRFFLRQSASKFQAPADDGLKAEQQISAKGEVKSSSISIESSPIQFQYDLG